MVKPIQSLTADEVGRISRVHVVSVTTTAEMSSWDVTLHSLATSAPLAHDVLNLERDDLDGIPPLRRICPRQGRATNDGRPRAEWEPRLAICRTRRETVARAQLGRHLE